MPILATVLGAVAVLASRLDGDDERAARLLGAADRLRGRPDRSNRDAEALALVLRERLGAARYETLHAEGVALDREGAVTLAGAGRPG
jgi:hypothetical protein